MGSIFRFLPYEIDEKFEFGKKRSLFEFAATNFVNIDDAPENQMIIDEDLGIYNASTTPATTQQQQQEQQQINTSSNSSQQSY